MPFAAHRALAVGAACLLAAGCAAPRLVLLDPGHVYLTDGATAVRVDPDEPLVIEWQAAGRPYSTATIGPPAQQPVRVRLVEADDAVLRVRADAWRTMADIPEAIRSGSGVRVSAASGRYRHPVLAIPVDSVTAIGIHRLLPHTARVGARDAWLGVGAGATWGMAMMAIAAEDDGGISGNEALAGTAVAALAGAVVRPVWRFVRPQFRPDPLIYPVGAGAYRLEIRR